MPRVMRVLTRPNVGGPTRQAIALWHALRDCGWQTLLVVGKCEDEPAMDLRAAGIPEVARDAVTTHSAGFVVVQEMQRRPRPLRDARAHWRLGRLMQAFAPNVVHTHTSKAGALARQAARRARVGVIAHTFHGHVLEDYFARWQAWLMRGTERHLARRTHLLFAVSASCRDDLVALGVAPADRIRVLPPAVDVSRFQHGSRAHARHELALDRDAFVLGFVGRLVDVKRPQMFSDLVARIPDAIGLVFGDGPLRRALEHAPRLRLLGATDRLPEWLPACDALVLTSVREGCPLAAVEAFAASVPVVGLDVPGVRDVLSANAGTLVPPSEGVDGLLRACAELRQPAKRDALISAGRLAVPRYSPGAIASQLVAAYAEHIQRKASQQ